LFTISPGSTVQTLRMEIGDVSGFAAGPNVASAATIYPSGNSFHVTGTTTITTVGATMVNATGPTILIGTQISLIFDGALTFTNGANLVLKGGVNATTAAGNIITLVLDNGSVWRETSRNF